jgi:hypothetical protein
VRYTELTSAGADGGKVTLEDDPRLEQLRPGDVIRIEGQALPDGAYRIQGIWLVRRAD